MDHSRSVNQVPTQDSKLLTEHMLNKGKYTTPEMRTVCLCASHLSPRQNPQDSLFTLSSPCSSQSLGTPAIPLAASPWSYGFPSPTPRPLTLAQGRFFHPWPSAQALATLPNPGYVSYVASNFKLFVVTFDCLPLPQIGFIH